MSAATVPEGRQLFITLVGGGNSTHCFAPLACAQGHKVAILTRRPADWGPTVEVTPISPIAMTADDAPRQASCALSHQLSLVVQAQIK